MFIYRKSRVNPTKLFGDRITPVQYSERTVKVKYGKGGQDMVQVFKDFEFSPFDGNPFIGSFEAGKITFEFEVPVELGDPLALSRGRLQVSSAVPNGPERPAT